MRRCTARMVPYGAAPADGFAGLLRDLSGPGGGLALRVHAGLSVRDRGAGDTETRLLLAPAAGDLLAALGHLAHSRRLEHPAQDDRRAQPARHAYLAGAVF